MRLGRGFAFAGDGECAGVDDLARQLQRLGEVEVLAEGIAEDSAAYRVLVDRSSCSAPYRWPRPGATQLFDKLAARCATLGEWSEL